MMTALRKQVSELTRKGFYLESERKQLLEKIKAVQGVECVCVCGGGGGGRRWVGGGGVDG